MKHRKDGWKKHHPRVKKNIFSFGGKHQHRKKHHKSAHKKHRSGDQPRHTFAILAQETDHHCWPRSKNGAEGASNIIRIPLLRHEAWHHLFENMPVAEIVNLVRRKSPEEIINLKNKNKRQRKLAWEIVFGYWKTTPEQRVNIIEKCWPAGAQKTPLPADSPPKS